MSAAWTANWYAVQTQPHAEMKALAHLGRHGFEVYLPRFLNRRRHAGRMENVSRPLFPSYLFVAIDIATQRWRCVNSTAGGDIIEQLKGRHDEQGFITLDSGPHFTAGDAVRVLDGAFSRVLGIYEGMTDHQRVAILLDLLGRKVRVQIDIDSVAAA